VSSTQTEYAVHGYARAAAAARLLTIAPRPWMTEAGVCPAPIQLRSVAPLSGSRDGSTGRSTGTPAAKLTHGNARQFDTYDPGHPFLRPPA